MRIWQATPAIVTSASPNAMRRITEFEGLRAILAWWVVWSHLIKYSGLVTNYLPPMLAWLRHAGYAVDVFIILSGFVIFLLLDNTSGKSYLQFMTERFFRIYPLYLVAFAASIILMPLKISAFTHGNWHELDFATKMLREAQASYTYIAYHIVSHLSLLHGMIPDELLPNSSVAFLAPAWSLSIEWQFYLIAPLLIFWVQRSPIKSCLIVGSIYLIRKLAAEYSFGYGAFLPLKFEFFAIGILSYYVYKLSQSSPISAKRFFPVGATVLLVGSTFLSFSQSSKISDIAIPLTIWLTALTAAIAKSINSRFLPSTILANFLNIPVLQSLGKVSYSTYVIHLMVFWILMWLLATVFPDTSKFTVLIVLGSIGSISVAVLSFYFYQWIEKPFIGIGKQVSKNLDRAKMISD
jgi:peptidoglycan/LPS O-acetylase OafA/YrhL